MTKKREGATIPQEKKTKAVKAFAMFPNELEGAIEIAKAIPNGELAIRLNNILSGTRERLIDVQITEEGGKQ